jgi:iron complex outermembrane receptor protein
MLTSLYIVSAFAADESEIVVVAREADDDPPMTTSVLDRAQIAATNRGQEMAFLLQQTPGVTAYSDSGGSSGYATFYVRGIHQTRLNLTLDGVPLADGEDFGVYFANYTNLAAGLGRVQVARGAGVSEAGAPAYGGAIDFQTADPAGSLGAVASLTAGSFGTVRGSFHVDTGELGHGWAGALTVGGNTTAGYRDNSAAHQVSSLAVLSRLGARDRFDAIVLLGRERQQLSYYAVESYVLADAPKTNPLGPRDRDAFAQDLVHLRYARAVGARSSVRGSVYYNAGYGTYDLSYSPSVYRYGLDGRQLGVLETFTTHGDRWTLSQGLSASHFYRVHRSDSADEASLGEPGSDRSTPADWTALYQNTGYKQEASAWLKLLWQPGAFDVYADAQVRYARFAYHGSQSIAPVSWLFVNPKIGLRRKFGRFVTAYASAARAEREPTRVDLFLGEDDATIPHDLRAVRPETVWDGEVGLGVATASTRLNVDAFWMEFRNEIASTGLQNSLGMGLRRNVPSSRRQGIELSWDQSVGRFVRLRNATAVMRARIDSWEQYFDVYDPDWNRVDTVRRTIRDAPVLLTPAAIVRQSVEVGDARVATGSVTGHWQSASYLDNTGNPDLMTPAFAQIDGAVQVALPSRWLGDRAPVRLRFDVTNLLGTKNIRPSGYAWQYVARSPSGDENAAVPYFYQQAGRAWYLGVEVGAPSTAPRRLN